jgi:3-hydroxyacyl-CoA dehydrogenase
MSFTVKAPSGTVGQASVVAQKKTKQSAIRTAVALIAKAVHDVTIVDEDGEVFSPNRFNAFFHKPSMALKD